MKSGDIGGPFVAIPKLPAGSLIVDSDSRQQQAALNTALQKYPGTFTTKELGTLHPRILLTGIDAGYTDDMLLETVIVQNPEIFGESHEHTDKGLKIVGKRPWRNPARENWVVEVRPDIYRAVQKIVTSSDNVHRKRRHMPEVRGEAQVRRMQSG